PVSSSLRRHPRSTLFPYTTLFRSSASWKTSATVMFANSGNKPTFPLVPRCLARIFTSGFGERPSRPFDRFGRSFATPIQHCQSRSEEHTSELQSRFDLVCRLLLEK